jgi:translation elongation factor EF-Tu-like GTPase
LSVRDPRRQDQIVPAQDDDVPFVLKVEDAFWVTGRGTAILGVIEQGVLHIGDHLEVIQPGSAGTAPLRCKCLHVDPVPRVTGRDPALGYPIGILIGADIEPDAIRAGAKLRAVEDKEAG